MKTLNVTNQEFREAAAMLGKLTREDCTKIYSILENKSFPVCLTLFNMLLNLERFNHDTKRMTAIKIMRPEILKEVHNRNNLEITL